MSNLIFTGTLTTVQPVSIVPPPPEGSRQDTKKVATMPVNFPGGLQDTAYIPAGTLRGTLRRAVGFALMQAAQDHDKPWTLERTYNLLLGQNKDAEQEVEVVDVVGLKALRDAEPMLALFGSGLGFKSTLEVAHAIPDSPVAAITVRGTRHDLDHDPEALDMMAETQQGLWRQRTAANNRRAKLQIQLDQVTRSARQATGKEKDDLNKKAEALKAAVEAEEAQMLGMAVSTRQPVDYPALPAGLTMCHSLRLMNATPDTEALLLAALSYLSLNPVIGAQRARGAGEIRAEYQIKRVDGLKAPETLGRILIGRFEPAAFELGDGKEGGWYEAALARWRELLKNEGRRAA
jgi:hypothetical protein